MMTGRRRNTCHFDLVYVQHRPLLGRVMDRNSQWGTLAYEDVCLVGNISKMRFPKGFQSFSLFSWWLNWGGGEDSVFFLGGGLFVSFIKREFDSRPSHWGKRRESLSEKTNERDKSWRD